MRWPNLLARFAQLFSACEAAGDAVLAQRLAGIAFRLRDAEDDACDGIVRFLDLLEANQLAALETSELDPLPTVVKPAFVDDFEDLLTGHRRNDGCAETAPRYRAGAAVSAS